MARLADAVRATVAETTVVVARNPEMADMSNPNGEVYGTRYDVRVETESGNRWVYTGASWVSRHDPAEAERQAEFFAARVNGALRVSGGAALDERYWEETNPVYGSLAYEAEGAEAEQDAWERANDR